MTKDEERMDVRTERDEELDGLASLEYYERLTEFIRCSTRHPVKDPITVVDFRPLYAVTIHHLQRRLGQEIQLILTQRATDVQLERTRELLDEYSTLLPLWPQKIEHNRTNCLISSESTAKLRIHPFESMAHQLRKRYRRLSDR